MRKLGSQFLSMKKPVMLLVESDVITPLSFPFQRMWAFMVSANYDILSRCHIVFHDNSLPLAYISNAH